MAKRSGETVTLHHADGVHYQVAQRKDKVMIVMSGSEGKTEHAEKLAWYLQDHQIPCLALGYFKTKHSPKNLDRIELENIEAAISWLKAQGYEKIGILAASKGAEYAAAAAIAYKELSCVILRTPSYFYSEGMIGKHPSGTSCWSYKGRALPYTPYKTRKFPIVKQILKAKEYNILPFNEGKQVAPESIIPIEQIQAPILLFSTKADTVWPSEESSHMLMKRLSDHNFTYPCKHVSFDHMSHMMMEYCGSEIKYFIKSEKAYPEECARERTLMGEETVRWIEEVWH